MDDTELMCNLCKKNFTYKSHYLRHINKKIKCKGIVNNDIPNVISILELEKLLDNINHKICNRNKKTTDEVCGFCSKKFSTKTNLKRHITSCCKDKKLIYTEKEKILYQYRLVKKIKSTKNIQENKEENKEEQKQEQQKQTIINNINNGTINNTTNNVNININNFGNEDLSHISKKDFINYINKMYDGLIKLIEDSHFSDNNKNNFNVYLTSIRNEFANIYENNTWKLKDVEDVIYQMKDDKLALLDKKVEEFNDDKLRDTLGTFKQRLYTNTEADKNLNKNIKLVMVNNSEKVITQRKKNKQKI